MRDEPDAISEKRPAPLEQPMTTLEISSAQILPLFQEAGFLLKPKRIREIEKRLEADGKIKAYTLIEIFYQKNLDNKPKLENIIINLLNKISYVKEDDLFHAKELHKAILELKFENLLNEAHFNHLISLRCPMVTASAIKLSHYHKIPEHTAGNTLPTYPLHQLYGQIWARVKDQPLTNQASTIPLANEVARWH